MKFSKNFLLINGAFLACLGTSGAWAQDTAPLADDEMKAGRGEISLRSDIVVSGRRGKMVNAGGLGARSILDTPFSITAVSEEEIRDRMVSAVDDVLKGDASVRTASNGTITIMPEVTVRGLLLDQLNSYKIDGLAFPNRTNLPVEHFSQVELLKGLSGFMFGFGTPGGIVNYITKRPGAKDALTLSGGFHSDGVIKGVADATVHIGNNDDIGLRVVGVHEQGDTYVDDNGHINRNSVSAALNVRLNDTFTLLADGLYQDRKSEGVVYGVNIGATTSIPLLDPINGRTNLSEKGSFFNTETIVATAGLDINIASNWKANISYRFAEMNAWWREGDVVIANANGDYTIREYVSPQTHRYNQVQGLVIGAFDTGPLEHQVTFGASWQKLKQYNDKNPSTHNLTAVSNIYNPHPITGNLADNAYDANMHPLFLTLAIEQQALFASDTITLGNFSLLAGARLNNFKQTNLNAAGNVTAKYTSTPVTPTIALRYKPNNAMTFYASYVGALEKGGQASILNANYGVIYGPLKSKQYEFGFKADTSVWGANIAAFRIERGAEYTNSANIYVQDGETRFQGIEAGVTLKPVQGLSLHAEGLYLDAKLTEAAVNVGNRIPGASKWQGTLQAEYSPAGLDNLKFIASLKYQGKAYLEILNRRLVPDFVTGDVAMRYTLDGATPLTFNIAIRNVADRKFWTIRNSGTPTLQPGAPRTVAAGVSLSF